MTIAAHIYPTTFCDAETVAKQIKNALKKDGCTPILPGQFGYFLIDDKIVPLTLKDRAANQLLGLEFPYGRILGKEDIFSEDFLARLDANEHAVLMPVVLELIAQGDFPLDLMVPLVNDYEWENEAV